MSLIQDLSKGKPQRRFMQLSTFLWCLFYQRPLLPTAFCVIYGLVLTIFSKGIISQFTKGDLEMIRVGTQSLRINGISFMLFGFYTVYSSLFLALGKGLAGFILGSCRQGICFVPVILILPVFWGINGILYVQPIADLLSAIITIFMALHLHKNFCIVVLSITALL